MEAQRFVADEVIPRLRGLLHAHAAWVAVAASVVLVALAPTAGARVAAVIYGAGLIALFTASALYHRWPGDPALEAVAATAGPLDDLRLHRRVVHAGRAARLARHAADR